MVKSKIEELFETIENSPEYTSYKEISNLLDSNKEMKMLVEEIKTLEQEATLKEYQNNEEYKQIDTIIKEKQQQLESMPLYQEYKNRMNELNDVLSISTHMIEEYINDKI